MYRLLIVDDEPKILEGMRLLIDWSLYDITCIDTALNYQQAIEKAIEFQPDIAIFDVCIGETKGHDIIRKLNDMNFNTQYIMMSGYDDFEFVREALLIGTNDYLLKPVDKKELCRVLEKVIVDKLGGTIDKYKGDRKNYDVILNQSYDNFSKLIQKVLLMVHGEYNKNINLKLIADMFGMNSTYLGQLFLKETNMKFSEYLTSYRLNLAKEAIIATTDKISSIALDVGYPNMTYFYSQFKSRFHISPSDLRKK